jgi:hypothetical protein
MLGQYTVIEETNGGQNIVFKVKKLSTYFAAKKYSSNLLWKSETDMLKLIVQKRPASLYPPG